MTEVHFIHGFLGNPEDWKPVVEAMSSQSISSFYYHDLYSDYQALQPDPSFAAWSDKKTQEFISRADRKIIVVGYSMGGRMALHLPADYYDRLLIVGSQTRLDDDVDKRQVWEKQWEQLAERVDTQTWLKHWNELDIFSRDQVRPQRQFSRKELLNWCQLMQVWSIRNQEDFDSHLEKNKEKIFWGCGERDCKYSQFKERMEALLTKSHIVDFSEAGHGVIFDQPQQVAQWLDREIQNVG